MFLSEEPRNRQRSNTDFRISTIAVLLPGIKRVLKNMIDKKLLSILVCPVSKGPLEYDQEKQELGCKASGLAYAIRDDIPVMLESEARKLTEEEKLDK